MVCLEFKPPSDIGCSLDDTVFENQFNIKVTAAGGLKVSVINPQLKTLAGCLIKSSEGDKALRMTIDADLEYGPKHGIYFAEDPDKNLAKRKAKHRCLSGTNDDDSRHMTSDNWAVQFNGEFFQ